MLPHSISSSREVKKIFLKNPLMDDFPKKEKTTKTHGLNSKYCFEISQIAILSPRNRFLTVVGILANSVVVILTGLDKSGKLRIDYQANIQNIYDKIHYKSFQ